MLTKLLVDADGDVVAYSLTREGCRSFHAPLERVYPSSDYGIHNKRFTYKKGAVAYVFPKLQQSSNVVSGQVPEKSYSVSRGPSRASDESWVKKVRRILIEV